MTSDGELLRRYAETNSEDAFAELVRRHLDLVYSAALRQVNGDAHLAQDVAQSVFADLARKAGGLLGRQAVAGWLYTGAHYGAAKAVRSEQRRHTREQEAHAMQELLHDSEPNPDWESLRPVLDTAMHELNESDREVIVLRYFENRPHAAIGEQLGLSENTARMRIERALEKLRTILFRRGITTSAAALSIVLAANAVQAAPAGLAVTISTAAAVAGTTMATTATATATKAVVMTTLQKTIIGATLAVAVGTGVYEASQASALHNQVQTLRQQQAGPVEKIQRLTGERDEAARQLAALRDEHERLVRNNAELARLSDEVVRLRREAQEFGRFPTTNEAMDSLTEKWLKQVNELKELVEQRQDLKIPEMEYLTEDDWLREGQNPLVKTEDGVRIKLAELRHSAKCRLINSKMGLALAEYIAAHDGWLPSDILQLKPYFDSPVDGAILQRYKVQRTGRLSECSMSEPLIVETAPVDDEYDYLARITASGWSCRGIGKSEGGSRTTWGTNLTARIKPFAK